MLGFMIWRPKGLLSDWEFDEWLYRRFTRTQSAPTVPETTMDSDQDDRLEVTDVSVVFGGFQALSQAGFEVRSGQVVGIIGPNGAGKTTMLKHYRARSRHLRASSAKRRRPHRHPVARDRSSRVGAHLPKPPTVRIAHRAGERGGHPPGGHCRARRSVHPGNRCSGGRGRLVGPPGRSGHELDLRQLRRLELARAAAARPLFLLLDEPTSGMSDTESLAMVEQVQTMAALVGAGVVVIDHDLDFIIGICDRIYCLDRGTVIAVGTPDEIQADSAVQAAYLGSSAS